MNSKEREKYTIGIIVHILVNSIDAIMGFVFIASMVWAVKSAALPRIVAPIRKSILGKAAAGEI